MITLFGYGIGGTVTNIPVVVVSQSNGPVTDATLNAIKGTSLYDVTRYNKLTRIQVNRWF